MATVPGRHDVDWIRMCFVRPAVFVVLAMVLTGCVDRSRSAAEAATLGTPRLEATPATIDLGAVPVGRWVTASFVLRNAGDAPLRFTDAPWVRAVAGC